MPVVLQSAVTLTLVPLYATQATVVAFDEVPDPVSLPELAFLHQRRSAPVVPVALVAAVVMLVLLPGIPGAVVLPLRYAPHSTRSPVLTALNVQDVPEAAQLPVRAMGEAVEIV